MVKVRKNIFTEKKTTLLEYQRLRSTFGRAKSKPLDKRQFQLKNKISDWKKAPKTFREPPKEPFFSRGAMLRNKKGQLILENPRLTRFKGKKDFTNTNAKKLEELAKKSKKELEKAKDVDLEEELVSFRGFPFVLSPKNKLKLEPRLKPRERIDLKPKQKPNLKISQVPKIKLDIRPVQQEKQTTTPIRSTRLKEVTEPTTKTTPTLKPKPITKQPTNKVKFSFSQPKPKPQIPKLKLVLGQKTTEKQAYEVFVRERNKWRKIARNEPKNKAYNIGADYTDTQPTTKFKLIQKGKTNKVDEPKSFINYKFSKNNNVYQEKKKYQQDNILERGGKIGF